MPWQGPFPAEEAAKGDQLGFARWQSFSLSLVRCGSCALNLPPVQHAASPRPVLQPGTGQGASTLSQRIDDERENDNPEEDHIKLSEVREGSAAAFRRRNKRSLSLRRLCIRRSCSRTRTQRRRDRSEARIQRQLTSFVTLAGAARDRSWIAVSAHSLRLRPPLAGLLGPINSP